MKFKVGDRIKYIADWGYEKHGLITNNIYVVVSINDRYVGFKCKYPGFPDVESGVKPNWVIHGFELVSNKYRKQGGNI